MTPRLSHTAFRLDRDAKRIASMQVTNQTTDIQMYGAGNHRSAATDAAIETCKRAEAVVWSRWPSASKRLQRVNQMRAGSDGLDRVQQGMCRGLGDARSAAFRAIAKVD